jgi:hypothetical protein
MQTGTRTHDLPPSRRVVSHYSIDAAVWNDTSKTNIIQSDSILTDLCYKTEFRDGTESYSETFDSDDPTPPYRYPTYDKDTYIGDRQPTPTQQRQVRFKRKASRKETEY